MAYTKQEKPSLINNLLIFLFFVVFSFGQLLNVELNIGEKTLFLHLVDVIVVLSSVYYLYKFGIRNINSKIKYLFIYYIFILILSLDRLGISEVIVGFLYTLKFFFYILFIYFINEYSMYKNNKNLLLGCLLIISVFSSIFGWVQYLLYPNLKFLKILGWDEHLYRLSGTFLDPNFMGLIIVFGIFVALKNISKRKNIFILVLLLFLVISLFFTYSRSSYLAFIGGVFFLYKRINLIKYFAFLGFFILFLTILPRKGGEGVRLERISSVVNRIDYAKKSLPFVYKYPLFGLGFNNMCFERLRDNIDNIKVNSKACSGVDSSLYLIIITTGLIGTILIFDLTRYLLISSIDIRYLNLFNAIAFSLLIHSLFVNSLFYSWTLGYFAVISGTLMKLNNRRKP